MTNDIATAIAALINGRNELARPYSAASILDRSEQFLVELRGGQLAGCVECKRVQWYQWEVLHLSVHADHEGTGVASALYDKAEAKASAGGARVLQCTIREGNERSQRLFARKGFRKLERFFNPSTRNTVEVWMKVLSALNRPGIVGGSFP